LVCDGCDGAVGSVNSEVVDDIGLVELSEINDKVILHESVSTVNSIGLSK